MKQNQQLWVTVGRITDGRVELEIAMGTDSEKVEVLRTIHLERRDAYRMDLASGVWDTLRPCDPDELRRFPDGTVG